MKVIERIEQIKKRIAKAYVFDEVGSIVVAMENDLVWAIEVIERLKAQVDLLSKKYYSALCTKCGYMRPATEIEKENEVLEKQHEADDVRWMRIVAIVESIRTNATPKGMIAGFMDRFDEVLNDDALLTGEDEPE